MVYLVTSGTKKAFFSIKNFLLQICLNKCNSLRFHEKCYLTIFISWAHYKYWYNLLRCCRTFLKNVAGERFNDWFKKCAEFQVIAFKQIFSCHFRKILNINMLFRCFFYVRGVIQILSVKFSENHKYLESYQQVSGRYVLRDGVQISNVQFEALPFGQRGIIKTRDTGQIPSTKYLTLPLSEPRSSQIKNNSI